MAAQTRFFLDSNSALTVSLPEISVDLFTHSLKLLPDFFTRGPKFLSRSRGRPFPPERALLAGKPRPWVSPMPAKGVALPCQEAAPRSLPRSKCILFLSHSISIFFVSDTWPPPFYPCAPSQRHLPAGESSTLDPGLL